MKTNIAVMKQQPDHALFANWMKAHTFMTASVQPNRAQAIALQPVHLTIPATNPFVAFMKAQTSALLILAVKVAL